MKKKLAAVNARFKELTPWLTDEERNKVYIKYVLYIVRYFPSKKTLVFAHDKTEFTSAEYCEFMKQIFPAGLYKHLKGIYKFLGNEAFVQVVEDWITAYEDTKEDGRKKPLPVYGKPAKRLEVGDIVKTRDGSVFKITGSLDFIKNTAHMKCLKPASHRHAFGYTYCIGIGNVVRLPSKATLVIPEWFPVGTYVTQIKEGLGGVYRITGEPDEYDGQKAERIVPRKCIANKRALSAALEPAYLSPEIFRAITPEEMNDKLINFIKFLKDEQQKEVKKQGRRHAYRSDSGR